MKAAMAAAAAIALAACGGAEKAPETGSVRMDVMAAESAAPVAANVGALKQALTTVNNGKGWLKVSGPNFYKAHEIKTLPAHVEFSPAPVGHYTYTVEAEIGSAKFAASGAFDVSGGKVTYLNTVMMQQTNPTVNMDVKAPFIEKVEITGLNAEGSGTWGEALLILAKINWPDNDKPDMDNLRVTWANECLGTKSAEPFLFADPLKKFYVDEFNIGVIPYAESWATLKSFCQGAERVTITAANYNNPSCSGEGCEIISSVSFTIPYNKQGYEAAVIDFNYDPNVLCDRVENAEPLPGGAVVLNALVTDVDSPESGWRYLWTSNCGGSFADATALDTTFYAPFEYAKSCKLTLKVTDGEGGENFGYVSFKTAPASLGFAVAPYVDSCDSTTWVCTSVGTYPGASAGVVNGALVLAKTAADGGGKAFGPNARILGVEGLTLSSVSFDAVGSIGGGSPRIVLNKGLTTQCPLELVDAVKVGDNYTFNPTATCGGVIEKLDIVGDMGGQPGTVTITNVKVNGLPVTM